MEGSSMSSGSRSPFGPGSARGQLALCLQEVLTAIARLRSDEGLVVEDAAAFRANIKKLLSRADRGARDMGYHDEHVRLAIYAVVAFVDESVLNSPQAAFGDWHHQPLQEEVFGEHTAGESFYHYLDSLLARQDSEGLADVLEVYQLCLLLGFRGRYAAGAEGERAGRQRSISEKIQRVRGAHGPMAPSAGLPAGDESIKHRDPWVWRLGISAGVSGLVVIIVYAILRMSQRPGLEEIRNLAAGIVG